MCSVTRGLSDMFTVVGRMSVMRSLTGGMSVMCSVTRGMSVMYTVVGIMSVMCSLTGGMSVMCYVKGGMSVMCSMSGGMSAMCTVTVPTGVLYNSSYSVSPTAVLTPSLVTSTGPLSQAWYPYRILSFLHIGALVCSITSRAPKSFPLSAHKNTCPLGLSINNLPTKTGKHQSGYWVEMTQELLK